MFSTKKKMQRCLIPEHTGPIQDQIDENPHTETTAATTERLYPFNHYITPRTRQISR